MTTTRTTLGQVMRDLDGPHPEDLLLYLLDEALAAPYSQLVRDAMENIGTDEDTQDAIIARLKTLMEDGDLDLGITWSEV